jgi:hypothetical protein
MDKALGSKSPFRDYLGFLGVVDFVVVGSIAGMPPHRVFRHTWRDSTL